MMGYGPMAGLMWIWPVLTLAGLAALGYLTYRLAQPPSTAAATAARTILDERYARGEIDDEEYQRRRSALRTAA
ncbi:putative membrane protein [Micromonospora purpureochromogenes]|uniref:Putative membrane protein n=1 Tax=Micromonospora purpureochromogenes TaxID=47872 RepID=A0A1C5AI52_9ACTN|nr:SHOCT domain-containing protein [Micromonospora purpureochromogenes]SCF44895.1 putative membrane protein [Micromonospora purpureochromogenes]